MARIRIPENGLDRWLEKALVDYSDNHQAFYNTCKKLDSTTYYEGDYEVTFVQALIDSSFGKADGLAFFLNNDEAFTTLTKPKREAMAFILRHPLPLKESSLLIDDAEALFERFYTHPPKDTSETAFLTQYAELTNQKFQTVRTRYRTFKKNHKQ
jgi:hypothetical protein